MTTGITPNDDLTALSDRQVLERISRQLEHLDPMLHEIHQTLRDHKPLLDRLGPLADPGKSMRTWLKQNRRTDG
jgi:hypothetical protein